MNFSLIKVSMISLAMFLIYHTNTNTEILTTSTFSTETPTGFINFEVICNTNEDVVERTLESTIAIKTDALLGADMFVKLHG